MFDHSPNDTNRENNDFNYQTLNEESYQSVFEDFTEETELSHSIGQLSTSPQKHHRTLLDEALSGVDKLETVLEVEDEPLYAKVNKPALTDYNNKTSPQMELKTFQSPTKDRSKEEQGNGESNNLGFAFSFLSSQDNSPQTPQRESARSLRGVQEESKAFHTPPQMQNSRIYRDLNNNNNSDGEILQQQEHHNIQQQGEGGGGFHNYQPKSLAMASPNKQSGRLANMKLNTHVEESNTRGSNKINKTKVIGGNELSEKTGNGGNTPTSPGGIQFDVSKTLDKHYSNFSVNDIVRQNFLPTTRVHGDTNEQENEIKMVLSNRSSTNGDEFNRKTSLTRLNMLNIQNQYQYQETTRSLSPIPNTNEHNQPTANQTSLIAPEMYGKPIISPRPYGMESAPSLPPPPQSLLNSTLDASILSLDRKLIASNKPEGSNTMLMRTIENDDVRVKAYSNRPEMKIFSVDRLKKTRQGNALLGRSEDHQLDSENFEEDTQDYRASKLLGTMSLSIERLNSPDKEEDKDEGSKHVPRAKLYDTSFYKLKPSTAESGISPRELRVSPRELRVSPRESRISPRESRISPRELTISEDLNIIRGSHQKDGESNVSTLRRRIDDSVSLNSPRKEESKPVIQENRAMQAWVKQTDFRPKITDPNYHQSSKNSPREIYDLNRTSNVNALHQSRIEVFSRKQEDPMVAYNTFRAVSCTLFSEIDVFILHHILHHNIMKFLNMP